MHGIVSIPTLRLVAGGSPIQQVRWGLEGDALLGTVPVDNQMSRPARVHEREDNYLRLGTASFLNKRSIYSRAQFGAKWLTMDWTPDSSLPNGGPLRLVSTTARPTEHAGSRKVSKVPGAWRALTVGEANAPERPVAATRTETEKRMVANDYEG